MNEVILWQASTWPEWMRYLVQGIAICLQLIFAAIVISRTGRTPYWALLTIIPYFYLPVIWIWALAFCYWPKRA